MSFHFVCIVVAAYLVVLALGAEFKGVIHKSVIKMAFLGDSGVGKTTMMSSFIQMGPGARATEPTIEASIFQKFVNVDGISLLFELTDTAGEEKYGAITKQYVRGADAYVTVFPLNQPVSFLFF